MLSAAKHAPGCCSGPGCCLLHSTTDVRLPGLQRPRRHQGPRSARRTLAPLLTAAIVIRQTRLPAQRRPLRAPSPKCQAPPPARQAAAEAKAAAAAAAATTAAAAAAAATAAAAPPPLAALPPWRLAQWASLVACGAS